MNPFIIHVMNVNQFDIQKILCNSVELNIAHVSQNILHLYTALSYTDRVPSQPIGYSNVRLSIKKWNHLSTSTTTREYKMRSAYFHGHRPYILHQKIGDIITFHEKWPIFDYIDLAYTLIKLLNPDNHNMITYTINYMKRINKYSSNCPYFFDNQIFYIINLRAIIPKKTRIYFIRKYACFDRCTIWDCVYNMTLIMTNRDKYYIRDKIHPIILQFYTIFITHLMLKGNGNLDNMFIILSLSEFDIHMLQRLTRIHRTKNNISKRDLYYNCIQHWVTYNSVSMPPNDEHDYTLAPGTIYILRYVYRQIYKHDPHPPAHIITSFHTLCSHILQAMYNAPFMHHHMMLTITPFPKVLIDPFLERTIRRIPQPHRADICRDAFGREINYQNLLHLVDLSGISLQQAYIHYISNDPLLRQLWNAAKYATFAAFFIDFMNGEIQQCFLAHMCVTAYPFLIYSIMTFAWLYLRTFHECLLTFAYGNIFIMRQILRTFTDFIPDIIHTIAITTTAITIHSVINITYRTQPYITRLYNSLHTIYHRITHCISRVRPKESLAETTRLTNHCIPLNSIYMLSRHDIAPIHRV